MNLRLTVVAGPFQGAVFPITGDEYSIGRDRSNTICLDDLAVSRRHAVITVGTQDTQIADLGSHNRTTVNGVPVAQRALKPGDQIRIGRSVLVVGPDDDADAPDAGGASVLVDETLTVDETVVLSLKDAVFVDPDRIVGACSPPGGDAQSLKCLLQVGQAIAAVRRVDDLASRLLETAASAIPAERGAILLTGPGGEFAQEYRWQRRGTAVPVRVPRSIVTRVVRERISICSIGGTGGSGEASDSVIASQATSVLAVPLLLSGQVVGVIYLDTSDPAAGFTEHHLQLLTGIAGMAAGGLDNAVHLARATRDNQRLQAELNLHLDMVGDGPRMQQVYTFIAKVAPTESTVLIDGESGTGKELVARAIHRNSPRAAKPFIAINCATLGETLLESELFGHERGAFTGAIAQKRGKLEEGQGGTVFLDEVGELAPTIQAKLLRVLQEREFERVGGTRAIKADIRLVTATNRDLKADVSRGAFRQDLYFRINVVAIRLPPLRERREDIPKLVSHFLVQHARKAGRRVTACSRQALTCLENYDWPGNVRELENAIERALVLGSAEEILPDDLPDDVVEADSASATTGTRFHDTIKQFKRQLVLKALEQANGNYTEAAKLLGLHPNNLHRLMTNLRLRPAKT